MHKALRGLIAVVGISVAVAATPKGVSFSSDIVPILKSRCAACHLTGTEAGKLSLAPKTAYSNLVNVQSNESEWLRVKPGSPDDSYLVMKLEGHQLDRGGKGAQMPFGADPLDNDTLAMIRSWIAAGAQNN
jgi:hypothetical protein